MLPIFKKESPHAVGNYRLISLLPILSEVYKEHFLVRLLSFLTRFNVISPRQFGICKDKNTFTAMNELL